MHKKAKRLLALSLVVCMILTNMLFSNLAFAATTLSSSASRFAGADRYATAIEISKAGFSTSQYAVLAYGEGFADALAAAPLAAKYDAPILLTDKAALSAGVLDELKRLGVKNVFVVGGEGVVSKAVADALTAASVTVERLAGADRYATALEVAKKVGTTNGVVVAYGENYPDALGISAIAAAKGMPILLTDKDAMSADVKAFIGTAKAYVVGGEGVVSAAVFNGLTGAVRLAGADRYATNLAVLQQFAADLNWSNVFVATGEGFADALAGSALAAQYTSPVVLAAGSLDAATASFLAGKVNSSTGVFAFGGAAVVSDTVVGSVKPSAPAALGVDSVTTLGLNGIRVVFSQEVDKDSAIDVTRYTVDGIALVPGTDAATLASDNKTLTILLNSKADQYKKKLFTIKDKVVLSKDTLTSIPKFEKELTFSDTAVPVVEKVSVTGNKKLTVQFNEPVLVGTLASYGTYFKIDGNYLSSYGFKDATVTTQTLGGFAYKADLNFDVAIPAGTHTLKTLKGDSTKLADAAGYFVNETDTSFTVDTVTTAPQVVSVTAETNGTIYVTFDRAMSTDTNSNVVVGKFAINSSTLSTGVSAVSVKSNTDDKVIKVVGTTTLNEGANVITIDNDFKDAWGNKLHADTDQRYSFNVTKDTTKPSVVSVVTIASDKIRVKYSEDVDSTFATTKSNYSLKDSSGVTKDIISTIAPEPATALDTYTLTLSEALTGSNYTLKIKNIVDKASPANAMDEYVATVNGIDDVSPQVTAVVGVAGSSKKVAVYFTESMDVATATDPANYAYKDTNTTSKTHALPSSAVITMGDTGKFVTIEFPSGYTTTTTNAIVSDYMVKAIRVSNVKDLAGNLLKDISIVCDVANVASVSAGKPKYNSNTFKLFKDSTSTRAEVEFDQVLTTFDYKDFYLAGASGMAAPVAGTSVTPTSGYVSGKKVVLNFDNDLVKYAVMGFGKDAYLYTLDPAVSANQSGVTVTAFNGANAKQVWDDQIKPEWTTYTVAGAQKYVGVTNNLGQFWFNNGLGTTPTVAATTVVVLKFTEALDDSIPGLYQDDFSFTQSGVLLTVTNTVVSGNYLIYVFKDTTIPSTSATMTVKAKSTVDIRDKKDSGAEDYNVWVPKTGDLDGRTN